MASASWLAHSFQQSIPATAVVMEVEETDPVTELLNILLELMKLKAG